MPLLVAGFVNADVHEVIKSSGAFRFDVVQSSVNAAPDRQIKVTGESASRICSGNIGCYDTMLRTLYAMCPALTSTRVAPQSRLLQVRGCSIL